MVSPIFNDNNQVFQIQPIFKEKVQRYILKFFGKSAYHVYKKGCSAKSVNTGKCVLRYK